MRSYVPMLPKWEIGQVGRFLGYTTSEAYPIFKEGDLVIVVEISDHNPNVLSCVKLQDYIRYLQEDPDLCGDQVWSYELAFSGDYELG